MEDGNTFDEVGAPEQSSLNEAESKKIKGKLRYFSKFYFCYFCAVIFLTSVVFAVVCFTEHNSKLFGGETFICRTFGALFVAFSVAAGIILIAYSIFPTKLYDSEKLNLIYFGKPKKAKKFALDFFYYFWLVIAVILFFVIAIFWDGSSSYTKSFASVSGRSHAVGWFAVIALPVIILTIAITVFKIINKKCVAKLLVDAENIDETVLKISNSAKFKPFEFKKYCDFRTNSKATTIRVLVVGLAYLVIFVLTFCLTAFIPTNPYRKRAIEKIDIQDNSGYVYRMLGEPFDKKSFSSSENKGFSGSWTWCSSGLAKQIRDKNKQLEKLSEGTDFDEKKMEKIGKLTEQIFNLELELSMTRCDYVTVDFAEGYVSGIEFKNDYMDTDVKEVKVKYITYSANVGNNLYTHYAVTPMCRKHNTIGEFDARLYLSDGSIVVKTVKLSDEVTVEQPTAKWRDEYGEHVFKVAFK